MFSSREDGLSPEELRKRLYQTFKNKGVLDTLKVSHVNTVYLCKTKTLLCFSEKVCCFSPLSLNLLQAQLRYQLIQELKLPLTGQDPVPRPVTVKTKPVLLSACNSIVADHLLTSGYEYTLSVFYPESGLSKDQVCMTIWLYLFVSMVCKDHWCR